MGRRYFGTDGIRGRVGESPVTPDFMLRLGWAAGRVLRRQGRRKVVIGKDTRISGYMFESALEAGLSAAGLDIALLGPMPTPAIAYLTRTLRASAGIVISASHNPYQDNGIKFFAHDGRKLDDAIEAQIESLLDEPLVTVPPAELGKAERIVDAAGRYIEFCKSTVAGNLTLQGLKLVVDCANGATYHVAPDVFLELGASVYSIACQPDGFNINRDCGSTRPEALSRAVVDQGADLGIAFDGDGDRVIMVDRTGAVVDGDELLFIIARHRIDGGEQHTAVVGTQMTNLGLERALYELGSRLHRVKVGDRYILERLLADSLVLGGETSGHIICLDKTTTGDGIVAALQVLAAVVQSGRGLDELKSGMHKYPQLMLNVPLVRSFDLASSESVQQALGEARDRLGECGRVLLRPSGTEPVIRVMVEGEDPAMVDSLARDLAAVVERAAA
ncbi:MAG: phosphoglucosamine mutase [Candidatus Competibacterales bacterium]|nr:phosphoglucosamine mutase [Candidatus Competibacterales bacterium]